MIKIATLVLLAAVTVPALAQSTYQVARGDTLFEIARKTQYEGVTPDQMLAAIYRANPSAFPGGNVDLLRPGQTLRIPSRQEVAAIDARQAAEVGKAAAARRYWDGLARERRGDTEGAFKAFHESAEAGHGLAQRRLAQIYDTGNDYVKRDYATALMWYQKARDQGVSIRKPAVRAPVAR